MMHRLLERQIRQASRTGTLDLGALTALVSQAYAEFEQESRRSERANTLATEEMEQAIARAQALAAHMSEQTQRFRAALDNMPLGVCLFSTDHRIQQYNQTFLHKLHMPVTAEVEGMTLIQALDRFGERAQWSESAHQHFQEYCDLPVQCYSEIVQQWSDGRTMRVSRTEVAGGGYLDVFADVSEQYHARSALEHLARFDPLTDLPNRRFFRDELQRLTEAHEDGAVTAALCLDLDRFKAVNDTLGHPVGDKLLTSVSARLLATLKVGDFVARLGGDEFAVILTGLPHQADAQKVAQRVIQTLSAQYEIDGHHISIGASIGIDFLAQGMSADEWLRNADLALYRAKTLGRGRAVVFEPSFLEAMSRRRQLEIDIKSAIEKGELCVYYQPIFHAGKDDVCGYEALVRWISPSRGVVPPAEFIPLAEETGLIDQIGSFVLRTACHDAMRLPEHTTMAVNVSPVQFRSRHLLSTVRRALEDSGLAPSRLEIEITEGVMIENTRGAMRTLRALKALGVHLSLDDFGTGYSSLAYIRNFHFDKIKIDQSFVRDLDRSADSLAIIRVVSGLCRSLGVVSTAEGVETQDQLDILMREQCDTMQGYLFGRPQPLTTLLEAPDARAVAE